MNNGIMPRGVGRQTIKDGLLSSKEVCERARITSRQLDHWIRSGVIALPSQRDTGSGTFRRFTDVDAARISIVAAEKRDLDERFTKWSDGRYWRELTS